MRPRQGVTDAQIVMLFGTGLSHVTGPVSLQDHRCSARFAGAPVMSLRWTRFQGFDFLSDLQGLSECTEVQLT